MGKVISLALYQDTLGLICECSQVSLEMSVFSAGVGVTGKTPTLSIRSLYNNKILDFSDNTFKLSGDVITSTTNLAEIGDGIYQHQINLNTITNIRDEGCFNYGLAVLYKEATTPAIDIDYIDFYANPMTMLADTGVYVQQAIKEILSYCNGNITRDTVTRVQSYKDRSGAVLFTLTPSTTSRVRGIIAPAP